MDIFEKYNIDHYMNEGPLAVVKKYRGRGIGVELLKTWWVIQLHNE